MKKYLFGSLAVILALGASAFTTLKSKPVKKSLSTMVYYYQLSTLTGANNPSNWLPEGQVQNPPSCEGLDMPCRLQFETTDFSDINAYLSGKTDAQVRDDAAHVIDKPE
jgi:hypothetical protein